MTAAPGFARIVTGRDVAPTFRMTADVVIVGTGAGGSMAAYELARAGLRVVAIERGSHLRPADMTQREEQMIPRLFAESGARGTSDHAISVLQGVGIGGSTLHNTNLCKRLPPAVIHDWQERFGVKLPGFASDFEAVEKLLGVHPVPDDRVNANNRVLERGLKALGYRGGRLAHNRDGQCRQSGFCELGCAWDGKMNASRVLIPPAVEAGALVLCEARAEQVVHDGRRATGVRGVLMDPQKNRPIGEFNIVADAVMLAGSATGSAALHIASELPDPHGQAGTRLHMHPGAAVMGIHDDEEIRGWEGNPQSIECTEFLQFGEAAQHRAWIVSGFAHPAGAASMLPGYGPAHADLMRNYARASVAISMVHDETRGTVRPGRGDHLRIHYRMTDDDRAQLALGLREAARLLLAGGADRVIIPTRDAVVVRNDAEIDAFTADHVAPLSPALTAVHPMSTLPMSARPEDGAVDAEGRHHYVPNVYVCDGSLFPTSIGGPPQVAIYAMGRRVARTVLADRPA